MSAKRLLSSAIIAYLGYRFWKAYERRQLERGTLNDAIPGLQRDDNHSIVWRPDGPQYAGVTAD